MANHSVLIFTVQDAATWSAGTTYNTNPNDLERYIEAAVLVNISAVASSPSLVITPQLWPATGIPIDYTAMGAITAMGTYRLALTNFGNTVSLELVVGGTGSLTGSIWIVGKT